MSMFTAVVLREGARYAAYSYGPDEAVPADAVCVTSIETPNGKKDSGKLRKQLTVEAKRVGLDPHDIRGLDQL
ncbi:MAG: hypothetical protein HY975_04440 [Candidatus Kerfeldbacteria bacterium]|nr:hypothetical protein [Candidatus Kerfeldbacteria bacterium]